MRFKDKNKKSNNIASSINGPFDVLVSDQTEHVNIGNLAILAMDIEIDNHKEIAFIRLTEPMCVWGDTYPEEEKKIKFMIPKTEKKGNEEKLTGNQGFQGEKGENQEKNKMILDKNEINVGFEIKRVESKMKEIEEELENNYGMNKFQKESFEEIKR